MIRIIDYGLGNILAFLNVFKRLNVSAAVARSPDDLQDATRLILPGVGAFDHAMDLLDRSGMRDSISRLVTEQRLPVLGVCVGMQILANGSDEGSRSGLGWIEGHVRSLRHLQQPGLLLPHMGWNDVVPISGSKLFGQLDTNARFYFLHSYYFECDNDAHVEAACQYGKIISCAVRRGNVFGVQFHPEKSHHYGMQLLKNFAEMQIASP